MSRFFEQSAGRPRALRETLALVEDWHEDLPTEYILKIKGESKSSSGRAECPGPSCDGRFSPCSAIC